MGPQAKWTSRPTSTHQSEKVKMWNAKTKGKLQRCQREKKVSIIVQQ